MNIQFKQVYLYELILYYFLINATIIFLINLFSKQNRDANKWFHLFFLSFIISFFDLQLSEELYYKFDWYNINTLPIRFAPGPLYWLYSKTLINPSFKMARKHFLLFIPFLLDIIYTLARALYVGTLPLPEKFVLQYHSMEFLIKEGLTILYMLILLFATFRLLLRYHTTLKEQFSNTDRLEIKWLQWTTIGFALAWLIWLGFYAQEWLVYPDSLPIASYLPLYITLIVLLLIMGYRSTIQVDLGMELYAIQSNIEFENTIKTKYESYTIPIQKIDEVCLKIEHLMQNEHLYRNSKLTLSDLSEKLKISNSILSQCINRGFKMNFYDYINKYRVEEVKSKLIDQNNRKYTIVYLAHSAGFNSKSTFNSAFKKFTGKSPSAFRSISQHNKA